MEHTLQLNTSIIKRYLPATGRIPVALYASFIVFLLIVGWQINLKNYITPESGIGYALGITGGVMMLLMLLYSLRKRLRFMHNWFATKYWFRMHMMFGVLGPTLILYHCRFSLGSTNSNVALFCMLVVAASGLVGRYIYRQIHYGLYGSKTTASQLKADFLHSHEQLKSLFSDYPELEQKLFRVNVDDLDEKKNLFIQLFNLLLFSVSGRWSYYSSLRQLSVTRKLLKERYNWDKKTSQQFFRQAKKLLAVYYATVRKIVGFQFYERLFSLWHVLHIPLFIMMIISGIVHVFAVHLY